MLRRGLEPEDPYGVTLQEAATIGSLRAVWTGPTGQPTWASVRTGLFGTRESLIPLHDAQLLEKKLLVPFDKETVEGAPDIGADSSRQLSRTQVSQLYEYYGVSWDSSYIAHHAAESAVPPQTSEADTSPITGTK